MVVVDGMPCIRRAGRVWMDDEVATEYLGKSSIGSYRNWVCVHGVTRVRHGKAKISPKDEIDRLSGSLPTNGK